MPRCDAGTEELPPVRTLDLFAGAGGLSEGFQQASPRFQVVRAVEMNACAAATFAENFGEAIYHGAIQDWLSDEEVPQADVVLGGPPCQGFSSLGKREAHDQRNRLWRSYAKAVRAARPKFFIMENVPQFLSSEEYPLLTGQTQQGGILEDYQVAARILNAAHFGTPQTRKRVIVIGWRRDLPSPRFPAPTNPSPESWRTVREAWRGLPSHVETLRPPERTIDFEGRALPGPYRASELHLIRDYREISLKRFAAVPPGGDRRDLPDELQMECWRRHRTGAFDVMGRLHEDRPSVTIRTEFTKPEKGRYLHPTENRAITIAEGARLQGFRDDYKFVGSLTEITRQIGNAVPIPLGTALGRHLLAQL